MTTVRIPSMGDVDSWFDLAASGATLGADDLLAWTRACKAARSEVHGALMALASVPPGGAHARAYDGVEQAQQRLERSESAAWDRVTAAMDALKPLTYAG